MAIQILSIIANRIKNKRLDSFIEGLEQKADLRQRNKRVARTLAQAKSVMMSIR